MKTLKVSLVVGQLVRWDDCACREEGQRVKPLGSRMAKVDALRELRSPPFGFGDGAQSASGEELSSALRSGNTTQSALMPSI